MTYLTNLILGAIFFCHSFRIYLEMYISSNESNHHNYGVGGLLVGIKWIIGAVFCVVVDALLILWLFNNYHTLDVVGLMLVIQWTISFVLGVVTGIDMKKYDLLHLGDEPKAIFRPRKMLRIIGWFLYSISFLLAMLTIQVLELTEQYPATIIYTICLGSGLLLSTLTFNGLGMAIAYPNKKKHLQYLENRT